MILGRINRTRWLLCGMTLIGLLSCAPASSNKTQELKYKNLLDSMVVFTPQDTLMFHSIMTSMREMQQQDQSPQQRIISLGKLFLGKPYVGHTLEAPGKEKLRVNFRGFDCTTYMENVVVLTAILQNENSSFDAYARELEKIRYRNGRLVDYPSRLHYLSDWLFENEKKGLLKNITKEIGGVSFPKEINFMSTHWEKYPALADSSYRKEIRLIEEELNHRKLFYIPKDSVSKVKSKIRNGDIIGITTNIKGLDLIHVGLAIFVKDRLHLMHASSDAKKIVISEKPLADYLAGNRLQTGIMVARLQFPNR